MPLFETEWARLKGAYEDVANDVSRTVRAIGLRAVTLAEAAGGFAPGQARGILEAVAYGIRDIDDLLARLEGELNRVRPPGTPPLGSDGAVKPM